MRREDVSPMLSQVSDRLPEPDLADAAWAAAVETRRRRRRSVLIGLLAALLIAVIAVIGVSAGGGDNADLVPPTTPPTNPADYVAPAGQIAGIDFWIAPPSGSERFLDRLATPLGDRLSLPDHPTPLADRPIDRIAAVVLENRGDHYVPLLLGADSSWARVDADLLPIRTGTPLSSGAVSPDGRIAAFPQPGELVTVDAGTAEVFRIKLPVQDVRSVAWLPDSQRVLVSGPGVAYRVLVGESSIGEEPLVAVAGAADPSAVTAPFRLGEGAVQRYLVNGRWVVDSVLRLPVHAWFGQTFSTSSTVARLFIANDLPEVPSRSTAPPQVVAAISTLRAVPSRLLVLGEPGVISSAPADRPYVREPGCCEVLGWYDDSTAVLQVRGWVLAWDLYSGRVRRVTELVVDGVAIGPGIRP